MPPVRTAQITRPPTKRERVRDAANEVREALYALGVSPRKPKPMRCADEAHKRRQFVILNVGAGFLDFSKLGRYVQFCNVDGRKLCWQYFPPTVEADVLRTNIRLREALEARWAAEDGHPAAHIQDAPPATHGGVADEPTSTNTPRDQARESSLARCKPQTTDEPLPVASDFRENPGTPNRASERSTPARTMRGKGKQVRIRRTPSVDVDDQATNGTVSDTVEDLDIPSNAIDEHLGPTIAALICTFGKPEGYPTTLKLRNESTLVLGDNKMLLAWLDLELWSDDEAMVLSQGMWTLARLHDKISIDHNELILVIEDGCPFNVNVNRREVDE